MVDVKHIEKQLLTSKRKRNCVITLVLTLFVSGYSLNKAYLIWSHGLAGDIGLLIFLLPLFIFGLGILLSYYFWNQKVSLELTEETKDKLKIREDAFFARWYIRYALAFVGLSIAYGSYVSYLYDLNVKGLFILVFNPIVGSLMAVGAIFQAKEISLSIIVLGSLYYLFIGLSSLSVSVAIIIGSLIIAIAIYIKR